jgi:hypothetical protein
MMDVENAQTGAPSGATHDLSAVVVPLLKGVLYLEDSPGLWNSLLSLQARVRDYVAVLGLELMLDEAEGYAFLRSKPEEEEENVSKLPRLVARRQLSFPVSLLLALLRKKLAEFDAGGGEIRLIDQIDAHLNKIIGLGFARRLRGQERMFEVRRILKAFVDAQWLAEFDRRLAEYQSQLGQSCEVADG